MANQRPLSNSTALRDENVFRRIQNLGSARYGLGEWRLQRWTAVALIPLGLYFAGSVLGFFEAIVSRYTLFSIETEGLCSPAPCELSVGGSAFFGQVALLLVSMVLLRLLPQGISGVRKGDR